MFQIRLHGRGGQGVVTSAEMLSLAAFTEGHYAQAFPSFGSERTGAPVVAFARVSDKPIRLREPIMEPGAVLIQDRTLLESVNVFSGLTENAYVLLNSSQSPKNSVWKTWSTACRRDTSLRCPRQNSPLPESDAPFPVPLCSQASPR